MSRRVTGMNVLAVDAGTNRYPSVPASAAQGWMGSSETETASPEQSCDEYVAYVTQDSHRIFSDYDSTLNGYIECAGPEANRGGRR